MENSISHTTSKGTIFIQPHSDDMVMSSYFLMRKEILPQPYYLLTVFGQSNWIDPIKKRGRRYTQKIDGVEVTHLRKNEDEKFAESLGLTLLFSDLKDCLLRNREVYFQPNKKLETKLVKQVRTIIHDSIKRYKVENMVAPFPSGRKQHYDHRIVREAVKSLPGTLCGRFFVDDIPYSRITNPNKFRLHLFAQTKVDGINEKFCSMKVYDSQMCKLFFDQVEKITKQNQRHERLFVFNNR
jgi:hypothetical protein